MLADLAEHELAMKKADEELAAWRARIVKEVDAANDLDFKMLDPIETAGASPRIRRARPPRPSRNCRNTQNSRGDEKGRKYEPDEE